MGMDSVELLLAIEEEFGVEYTDDIAARTNTVGDVFEFVKTCIAKDGADSCQAQSTFYKLRRALVENYRVDRNRISPETRLTDVLSVEDIEDGWPFLQMFIDLNTPPLPLASKILGVRWTVKSATMRELVHSLILLNRDKLLEQWDTSEIIWYRLVGVFVRQLNINFEEVKPEASITRDLGCD